MMMGKAMLRTVLLVAGAMMIFTGGQAYAVTSKISANFGLGSVIIGPDSDPCTFALRGAIKFTSGSPGTMAYCDGVSAWVSMGGGGGSAGGANTQIQYNSTGTLFGGSSYFTYDMTNNILAIGNTGTSAFRAGSGTVTLPSHSFSSGTGTGMWMSGAGTALDFSVGGVDALQLATAASGVNYLKMTPGMSSSWITLNTESPDTNGTGLGMTVQAKAATATGDGGAVTVSAGAGSGSGDGGGMWALSNAAGATSGNAGALNLSGGAGGSTSGNGGSVILATGGATSATSAGTLFFDVNDTDYLTLQPPGTANASAIVGGTSAVTVPSGTTAQRPTSPVNGMIRYNTTSSKFEAVQGGGFASILGAATTLDDLSDAITNYTGTPSATSPSTYSMYLGYGAGVNATSSASYNTALGYMALASVTSGSENSAIGYMALSAVSTGSRNTAGGSMALMNNLADDNTAFGYRAMVTNTTGTRNTAVGGNALAANTIGNDNTALGYNALAANVDGNSNSAMGGYAMASNVSGSYNTAMGYLAMASSTGSYNTFIGWSAGKGVGGNDNTGVGALTFGSANFTGSRNTGLGYGAGSNVTTGTDNTFLGYMAGSTTTTGSFNIMIGASVVATSATASNELNIGNVIRGITGGTNYVFFNGYTMSYAGTTPAAPAAGVCGTNAATIVGNDNEFVVTKGSGTDTATCTVAFANSWTNAPQCIVSTGFSSTTYISAVSTTSITITHTAASSNSKPIYVHCRGYL